jgi:hypothetical protein
MSHRSNPPFGGGSSSSGAVAETPGWLSDYRLARVLHLPADRGRALVIRLQGHPPEVDGPSGAATDAGGETVATQIDDGLPNRMNRFAQERVCRLHDYPEREA